jgi:hypothetical protein
LIDEYEFVVQPSLAGHGPTLFEGLSRRIDLKLVSRLELTFLAYKGRGVRCFPVSNQRSVLRKIGCDFGHKQISEL